MPTRWFLSVPGIHPGRVKRSFAHAAVSRWFDHSDAEHAANDKPYTISSVVQYRNELGIMITTLTDSAEGDLLRATGPGVELRLGNQIRRVGALTRVHSHSWGELKSAPPAASWVVDLVSPTTFRSGDRSSPLPSVNTILDGLARNWSMWSGLAPCDATAAVEGGCWVSDLDLRSGPETLEIRSKDDRPLRVVLACVTGSLTLRCGDAAVAAEVAPLLRLAQYTGVGAMRGKGLGLVRVRAGARLSLKPTTTGGSRGAAG